MEPEMFVDDAMFVAPLLPLAAFVALQACSAARAGLRHLARSVTAPTP
jgi:hypothetical protein